MSHWSITIPNEQVYIQYDVKLLIEKVELVKKVSHDQVYSGTLGKRNWYVLALVSNGPPVLEAFQGVCF
jgi:hypothetical protein